MGILAWFKSTPTRPVAVPRRPDPEPLPPSRRRITFPTNPVPHTSMRGLLAETERARVRQEDGYQITYRLGGVTHRLYVPHTEARTEGEALAKVLKLPIHQGQRIQIMDIKETGR